MIFDFLVLASLLARELALRMGSKWFQILMMWLCSSGVYNLRCILRLFNRPLPRPSYHNFWLKNWLTLGMSWGTSQTQELTHKQYSHFFIFSILSPSPISPKYRLHLLKIIFCRPDCGKWDHYTEMFIFVAVPSRVLMNKLIFYIFSLHGVNNLIGKYCPRELFE